MDPYRSSRKRVRLVQNLLSACFNWLEVYGGGTISGMDVFLAERKIKSALNQMNKHIKNNGQELLSHAIAERRVGRRESD